MKAASLGQHARLIRGITFKPTDKCGVGSKDSLVCLRTANVQQSLDESDLIAIPASIVKNPDKIVRIGDILVSSANSWNLVGKCCRVESLRYPSTAGGFISILRADPSYMDAGYLYRWFASDRTQVTVRSFGNQTTNISNLDHTRTLSLPITLPPLPVQKRIAAILDSADALRAKRRESIDQLDSLVQATFLEMFGDPVTNPKGWVVSTLGEACLGKPAYGSGAPATEYDPASPRYVRITDIHDSGQLGDDRKSAALSPEDVQQYRLRQGDLLFARSGATVGKTYLYRESNGPCVYAGYLIRFCPNPAVLLPEVLFRFTKTLAYRRWVESVARAVAQPNINAKMYAELGVMTPPLDVQTQFVEIVESIEQQKARLKAHLTELDALFASLQSRAFNGELVA